MPRRGVIKDISGERFGRLTVLGLDHIDSQHQARWLCECDCGNHVVVRGTSLRNGQTTSCGCRKRERRSEDLTGKRFGRLYVLDYDHTDKAGNSYWLCECDCGNTSVVKRSTLLDGRTKSCGCGSREGSKPIDLTGERFGSLYVIGLERRDRRMGVLWRCECDCGDVSIYRTKELTSGHTTSCGCLNDRPLSRNKDASYDLFVIWTNMRQRCNSTTNHAYDRYGGRGIDICEDWNCFENFRDWALTNGYEKGLTLDREDNDDGYYPDNCRWVDYLTQNSNRRSNHYVTYGGTTHTVAEWSRLMNIDYHKLLKHVNKNDMSDFEDYFD